MKKITPLGTKLIVLPSETQNTTTEGGIEIVQMELEEGIVIEVGTDVTDVFSVGDRVLYPAKRGTTITYNGRPHIFLDGLPVNGGGDCWGVVTYDAKPLPTDKGDSL